MSSDFAACETVLQSESNFCKEVIVANQSGLHARPAGILAKEAQRFQSDIFISKAQQKADAKSILDILTLEAEAGSSLQIKAVGHDAEQALDSLEILFQDRFGEKK